MPRFSANISTLFRELDMIERPRAARRAGFGGVEVQFPYRIPAEDWQALRRQLRMPIVLFNIGAGDLIRGGQGLAAVAGREGEFRDAVEQAARYAEHLAPRSINVLSGAPEGDRDRALEVLVANVTHAAEVMSGLGVKIVVEPVNSRDRPGTLLTTLDEASAVIDWAGHSNLAIQADLYHMQIMEGDLVRTLERHIDRIGHIQFADPPARNEPGTGEINFSFVFDALDRVGYDGWVGAEYVPSKPTGETLGWLAPYKRGGAQAPKGR